MKRVTVPRGRRWSAVRRQVPNVPAGAAVVMALVSLLAALAFLATLPRQLDLMGARPHRLTGVVTQLAFSQRPVRLVLLRVGTHPLDVSQLAVPEESWLRLGRSISVTYREGKSGRWYADHLKQAPDQDQQR